ncbi:hypothetical protein DPMN_023407 [Dreissena polymorpha]|uniref:Uncharacterized protein n=1 Tax=Dreissena polymorpha TaxID=45954 RepID=A0A9D4R9W2_DREPO|nr:hypothetical protein DPMN_023407 [Dreissena polymorpha]
MTRLRKWGKRSQLPDCASGESVANDQTAQVRRLGIEPLARLPKCAGWGLSPWPDCPSAQTGLELRWPHMPYDQFFMMRL